VVFLGDLEKMNAVIARVEKQQREDPNASGVGSGSGGSGGNIAAAAAAREVGSGGSVSVARSISTDSASLTSAPKVCESENANTSTSTRSTVVQRRKMVLLFAINAMLLAFLCLVGGVEILPDGIVRFMHVLFLIFQGMLLVWHLWPSP